MPVPTAPKIYHIVHVDNLASIVADGCILSDAVMLQRGGPPTTIGMQNIKTARLTMPVRCHAGTFVGEYVPFNLCPRSVMLNLIWYGNHPNLSYRGGQQPIVHLEADLLQTVDWAERVGARWAFTLSNARATYVEFRSQLDQLNQINWSAVAATNFRAAEIKEAKQAEFLVEQSFPWHLVERIGIHPQGIAARVSAAVHGGVHRPRIEIRGDWYF